MQIKSIKKGTILVARTGLNNEFFSKSVILITEYSEKGAMGFIINKPTTTPLDLLLKNYLYTGGPVTDNEIFIFHNRPDIIKKNIHISGNIYWAQDYKEIKDCINKRYIDLSEVRIYKGYCGWIENQLEREIEHKEWNVINALKIDIFKNLDKGLWVELIKKIGGENLIWLNTPSDPSMN